MHKREIEAQPLSNEAIARRQRQSIIHLLAVIWLTIAAIGALLLAKL